MAQNPAVRRLDLGYFIRPAAETGGPQPRIEPVLGYLVSADRGLLLFDTGIGSADLLVDFPGAACTELDGGSGRLTRNRAVGAR